MEDYEEPIDKGIGFRDSENNNNFLAPTYDTKKTRGKYLQVHLLSIKYLLMSGSSFKRKE